MEKEDILWSSEDACPGLERVVIYFCHKLCLIKTQISIFASKRRRNITSASASFLIIVFQFKRKRKICVFFGLEKLNFCWWKMVGGGESGKWVSVKFNATKRDDDSQRRPMENCFICTTNWVKNSENWRCLLSQDAAQHPQFLGEHLQTNNLGIETIWVKWKKNQRKV